MIYVTSYVANKYSNGQLNLFDFIDGNYDESDFDSDDSVVCADSATRTYRVSSSNDMKDETIKKFLRGSQYNFNNSNFNRYDYFGYLYNTLRMFNTRTASLKQLNRHDLYYSFSIPKKSHGWRKIDAPLDELDSALRELKSIFETCFCAKYHTSAFAYVKKRNNIKCVQVHQGNNSRWFLKLDLSNFFGSINPDFAMHMLLRIFPFSELSRDEYSRRVLREAIELAFLDGGLPQGTPLSPMFTNLLMIPIDYEISKSLREYNKENKTKIIYTRYADDFYISSKYKFNHNEVLNIIETVFEYFSAPFVLNKTKTKFGSSAGKNWILGLMLNSQNNITIGHKKKKEFQAMLTSFVLDTKNNNNWSLEDLKHLEGYLSYYQSVEKETIDAIVKHLGAKFGVDIPKLITSEVKRASSI